MPDTGGMNLSVGIGLNLTGFEALTQITKELEVLQQMAGKTEQAFQMMGNALRQTMNMGTSEMNLAAERMERASRVTRQPVSVGVTEQAPVRRQGYMEDAVREHRAIIDQARFSAAYENRDFDIRARAAARALRDNERAIREETETRRRAWEGFRTGLGATLGFSATMGTIELGKSFVEAAARMDDRRASLRLQGLNPEQTSRMSDMALRANAPGLDLAEKVQLGQQIGTAVGQQNVTPEALGQIAVAARATTFTSGGSMKENIDQLVQASQSMGNLIDSTGRLSAANLARNAETLEHIMALGAGRFSLEHANTFFGASRAGLQGLNVAGNRDLQADLALLLESKGVNPKNVNQALRFLQGGHLDEHSIGPLYAAGMLKMQPGGLMPSVNPLTGKTVMSTPQILNIPHTGDPFDFFRQTVDRLHARNPNIPIQNLINSAFPTDVARVVSALTTPTAREEQQRNKEALARQPQGAAALIEATQSFNQSLTDVQASFREFAQVVGGPMMHDAASIIESIARGLHMLSIGLSSIAPVLPILTRLAEVLALLAGLRLLRGIGGRAGGAMLGLMGLGAGMGSAPGGAAAGAGVAEGVAAGAVGGRLMASMGLAGSAMTGGRVAAGTIEGGILAAKAGAIRMAGRGMTAFLVSSIADSVIDSFTAEGSDVNSIMKDAVEGSSIGATVAGWPGAIIGAILDVVGKPLAREAQKGLAQVGKQHEDYQKAHPSETYVDPYDTSGGGYLSHLFGIGPKNADVLHQPLGNASTIAHMNAEHQFQNTPASQTPITGYVAPTVGRRPNIPRQMHVTRPPNDILPSAGHVHQTDVTSPLARRMRGEVLPGDETLFNRNLSPAMPAIATPNGVISPTRNPAVSGITSASPSQTTMPALRVSTIETNMLIVRGSGLSGLRSGSETGPESVSPGTRGHHGSRGLPGTDQSALQMIAPGEPSGGLVGSNGSASMPAHANMAGHHPNMAGQPSGGFGATPVAPLNLAGSTFAQKAPAVMQRLQKDLGLTKEQAAGILGNLGRESGLQAINEKGKAPGTGGFGWAQWTGPRRQAFMEWSKAHGLDPKSDTANLGFLEHELTHGESRSLTALKRTNTTQEATSSFMMNFERPGVPAFGNRMQYANAAFSAPNVQGPQPSPEQSDVPASQLTVHVHSQHMLDGDLMAENMATHFIGGGATASPSTSGYDSKMMPLAPGVSVPRW
jgi:hypothetical protein